MSSRLSGTLNRILFVAALLTVCGASSSGQTISDSNQNQTWGIWKTPNPATPGLQFHARCDKDIDSGSGTPISSWWSYQFRNTYKGTMDFIYLMEGGIADPKVNKMVGGFKFTLKPGEIFDSGALLWGSCSQHSGPKGGLHMTLKCVVPTGQDSPCFNDADGNPYPQAKLSNPSSPAKGSVNSKLVQGFWYCVVSSFDQRHVLYASVFQRPADHEWLGQDISNEAYGKQFSQWAVSEHPDWPQPNGACYAFKSQQDATNELQKAKAGRDEMLQRGASMGDVGTVAIVDWSPK